jgi:hypothetical protein
MVGSKKTNESKTAKKPQTAKAGSRGSIKSSVGTRQKMTKTKK